MTLDALGAAMGGHWPTCRFRPELGPEYQGTCTCNLEFRAQAVRALVLEEAAQVIESWADEMKAASQEDGHWSARFRAFYTAVRAAIPAKPAPEKTDG